MEQLVSLLIIDADARMSFEEIEDKLTANGLDISTSELETTLNTLLLTSILAEDDGYYQFLAVEFPRIFRAIKNVKDLIQRFELR